MVWTIVLMKLFVSALVVVALYCGWKIMHAKTTGFWAWVRCETGTWGDRDGCGTGHNPKKHPLGGYKCDRCGEVGGDLSEFGLLDDDEDYRISSRRSRRFVRAQRSAGEDWQ